MNIKETVRKAMSFLMALLLPGAQAAWALEGAVELGGRQVSVTGSEEKFNEYRDLRKGLFVDELSLGVGDDSYFLNVDAENGGLQNERYSIEGGRYGRFKAAATYDRTPHNFSRGRHILSGMGTGHQGLSSGIRQILENNEQTRELRATGIPTTDTTGGDAVQRGYIQDLIANTDEKSFGLERRKGAVSLDFNATDRLRGWVKAYEERRSGARQLGTGSYERHAQTAAATNGDGGHTSDMFVVLGQAVAEPIDYVTTSFGAGAGYYDRKVSADLEYTFTEFKDDLLGLTWANPFRVTDAASTNGAGAASNAYNRARFATGRLALPPSSKSHDFAGSASVELPLDGRLTAALGYGTVSQYGDLLPYTANSALAGAGGGGGPANVTSEAALPVARFSGKVNTLSQSLLLTLRPLEGLTTKAKYRAYTYDNRSPRVTFAGYAAFGESYWRAVKNDQNAAVVNEPVSYNRQTAELGADYEVFGPLTVGAESFWDRWAYKNNRAGATDEVGLGASAGLHLGHTVKAHAKYRWAHRALENYVYGPTGFNPEATGLVNYNWADRVRQRVDAGLSVMPAHGLSLGVSGLYQDDELGRDERFGLKGQEVKGVTVDVGFAPTDAFDLSLTVGKEERRSKLQNGAKDNAFNNTATSIDDSWSGNNFNPLNYWNTETADKVDTVSIDASYRPGEKWEFGGGYSFSYGRTSWVTNNPNEAEARAAGYAQGAKLANGVAQVWPTMTSRLHELRAGGAYKLTKDVSFGLDYAFAKYMLSDFANVGEYVAGSSAAENSTRFVLTGADKYSYTAHMIGAKASLRF